MSTADAGRFVIQPAVPEWSDFNDRRGRDCIFIQSTLSVRLNMSGPNNGQTLIAQDPEAAQGFTAERVLRTRPKTYRAIVQLLADPHASVNQIAKFQRVSTHTVRAIRHREARTIAERKKTLAAMLANVAELGAARMEETIGKASLRDATIGTGVAVDKIQALTDQTSGLNVNIVNIPLPTPEERELLNECHRRLRAVAIGESKDLKADIAWIVAYSKWEESNGPQLLAEQHAR